MNRRLIYVVGPSGAGKDSVLDWLRGAIGPTSHVHWARRTITRSADAGREQHEAVSMEQFRHLVETNAFAHHWQANGNGYGIRRQELLGHASGQWVFVNGSREHLCRARQQWPGLTTVWITAGSALLRDRLLARQRESGAEIDARLQRNQAYAPSPDAVVIHNEGDIAVAGQQLLTALSRLPHFGRSHL